MLHQSLYAPFFILNSVARFRSSDMGPAGFGHSRTTSFKDSSSESWHQKIEIVWIGHLTLKGQQPKLCFNHVRPTHTSHLHIQYINGNLSVATTWFTRLCSNRFTVFIFLLAKCILLVDRNGLWEKSNALCFIEVLLIFYLSIFHPLLEATLASLRSSMSVCENVLKSCGVKEFRLGFAGAWVPNSNLPDDTLSSARLGI